MCMVSCDYHSLYTLQKKRGKFPPHWWKNHTLYHFHHGGFACIWVLHQFECVVTTSTWWSALITMILSRHVISMWLQFKSGAKQLRFLEWASVWKRSKGRSLVKPWDAKWQMELLSIYFCKISKFMPLVHVVWAILYVTTWILSFMTYMR